MRQVSRDEYWALFGAYCCLKSLYQVEGLMSRPQRALIQHYLIPIFLCDPYYIEHDWEDAIQEDKRREQEASKL